jgi:hypothetical protein
VISNSESFGSVTRALYILLDYLPANTGLLGVHRVVKRLGGQRRPSSSTRANVASVMQLLSTSWSASSSAARWSSVNARLKRDGFRLPNCVTNAARNCSYRDITCTPLLVVVCLDRGLRSLASG